MPFSFRNPAGYVLLATCLTGIADEPPRAPYAALRNAAGIAAVVSGRTNVANAAWWGFDATDATTAVQAAIDSGASRVVVPFVGAPWVVRPIELRSDLELVFEPGVVVLAKAGEFRGGGDSLFRAVDRQRIRVRGHGATLRMRKRDYQEPPYPKAEWRMGLSFTGCRDVLVEGLRIESSGGDGIYIGSSRTNRWCEDVTIRNCVCHDHHRQGLSVISAVRLLVENCTFSGTSGTPPEAGIDLEPDEPDERLVDCVIRNCVVEGNRGNGLLVYLKPLNAASAPVSIRFENCHVRGAPDDPSGNRGWSGIAVLEAAQGGPRGLIEFVRCTTEGTGREAVRVTDKAADGIALRFIECRWHDAWEGAHQTHGGPRAPILIRGTGADRCRTVGGIEFIDCFLADDVDGASVWFDDGDGKATFRAVRGTIQIANPRGRAMHRGSGARDIELETRALPGG